MDTTVEECAAATLDTLWVVMRAVKGEARASRPLDLSVPQYRVLWYVRRHEGCSPSDVAQHLSLSRPSVSAMVDLLVERDLLARAEHPTDRRCLVLTLTDAGTAVLAAVRSAMQERLADRLRALSPDQREVVAEAMHLLREAFSPRVEEGSRDAPS